MGKGFNFKCFVLDDYLELGRDILQDFRLFPNVESDHILCESHSSGCEFHSSILHFSVSITVKWRRDLGVSQDDPR